jgi:hypothetical protein
LATSRDSAWLGCLTALCAAAFESLNDVHTFDNFTENDVFSIEPWAWDGSDEELGSVSVRTSVGHGKKTWLGVFNWETFIIEFGSVDGFTTSSVSNGEVTTLDHELWDDSVEWASLVAKVFSRSAFSLFTSAKSTEVFASLWEFVIVKLENDTACWSSADCNIKVAFD